MRSRVKILDARIDAMTITEAIIEFERLIARRRPSLVYNVNVDICMKILGDPELRAIYGEADLVLVDGTPMMWAGRFLGSPFPGRVSGSDFVPAFCEVAARKGYRVFLLGGRPGVALGAKQWLESRNPDLNVAGTYAPPLGFERDEQETARIVATVREANADALFVALGTPKQEKWLHRFRDTLNVPVSMGIGSTLDYLAGRLNRAPMWMQRAGLEWTYRLAQEPRRLWRRYLLEDPPFAYHIIRQRLQGGLKRPAKEKPPLA